MAESENRWWIWGAWLTIGVGVVGFGIVLFTLYGINLGPISHKHAAWSSFGSLLSGFFMVASTGATVATLLFLAHQNKQIQKTNAEQQRVTNAQLAAVIFEQYVNHRRFFMERLSELQSKFGNRFVFENGDALYTKVFPKNGPTKLELQAEVVKESSSRNYLGDLHRIFSLLKDYADNVDIEKEDGRWLVCMLIELSEALGLRMIDDVAVGDVVYKGKRTAVNIYGADEFVSVATAIYDSFMFFTGNEKAEMSDVPMGRSATDSLMKYSLKGKQYPDTIKVLKPLPGLETLERIYFELCEISTDHSDCLKPIYARFLEVFRSKAGVQELRSGVFFAELLEVGRSCTADALARSKKGDDDYDKLKEFNDDFELLISIN
ncbi:MULTISPECIES: hypothetical protein [Pseudomonas]|uniref:hypothetical protein n=1 Tax=Pseudomonas TaxID=286 RepID=UPI00257CE3FA|nr:MULTISPECIES: hypothetical protein [Pseudomonas]